jgi:hypothetical protein
MNFVKSFSALTLILSIFVYHPAFAGYAAESNNKNQTPDLKAAKEKYTELTKALAKENLDVLTTFEELQGGDAPVIKTLLKVSKNKAYGIEFSAMEFSESNKELSFVAVAKDAKFKKELADDLFIIDYSDSGKEAVLKGKSSLEMGMKTLLHRASREEARNVTYMNSLILKAVANIFATHAHALDSNFLTLGCIVYLLSVLCALAVGLFFVLGNNVLRWLYRIEYIPKYMAISASTIALGCYLLVDHLEGDSETKPSKTEIQDLPEVPNTKVGPLFATEIL